MRWLGVSVGLILGLAVAAPVQAAEAPTFSGFPATIQVTDETQFDVSFAGDKKYYANKTYYLRGVFYQSSGQYFGFTQNNAGEWINSAGDPTKLYQFETDSEGSWSGKLKVKTDQESDKFNGPGSYSFKVGRYTSGGSVNWSSEQTVTINAPTPTPTSTASPTPTSTPTPTPTPPTPKTSGGTAPKPTASAQVLAATVAAEITETPTATPSATPQPEVKKQGKWPWLMMLGGGGLAVAALFPFLRKWYHDPSWLKTLLKGGDQA